MLTTLNKNINFTFRLLYVLAIFMIVDGHIGSYNYLSFNELFPYQNFHVALFIFASGYFINLNRDYLEFISHKFLKLILPLYIWNFIYGGLSYYLNKFHGFSLGNEFNWYNLLYAPIVDGHQFIYNMASWFLVPLFAVQFISFIILKPFYTKQKSLSLAVSSCYLGICILFGYVALITSLNLSDERNLFLTSCRIFYLLPFYGFGIFYRYFLEKYDTLKNLVYLPLVLILTIILKIMYPNCAITPSWMYYNSPIWVVYAIGFLSILFWLRIAKIFTPIIEHSKTLNYISCHTFDIMMHHFVGFMIVKALLSPFGTFDNTAFKNSIWYYHYPFGEAVTMPIYIFITLVIALFIGFTNCKIWHILKEILINLGFSFNTKRKDIAMTSNQQGRSMIEMLGVLAIVGVLSVGGIAGYSKALAKAKNNALISQISELTINIRSLYTNQHSFVGLTNETLIKTGFVPKEMLDNTSSPTSITHAFSGDVLVFPSKTPNGMIHAFEIYFTGLQYNSCVLLATTDWGKDPSSGFQSIYVGTPEDVTSPLMEDAFSGDGSLVSQNIYTSGMHDNAAPLPVHEAVSACACPNTECVVGLKYL